MKLYNILLLLHGEILNQVRLEMVTASEINILRVLHAGNNDPVQDIVHVANTNRSDMAERRRLANKYSPDPFSLDGEVSMAGAEIVNKILGTAGVPLPQEVPMELMDDARHAYAEESETIEFVDATTGATVRIEPREVVETAEVDPFAPESDLPSVVPAPVADSPRRSPLRMRAEA